MCFASVEFMAFGTLSCNKSDPDIIYNSIIDEIETVNKQSGCNPLFYEVVVSQTFLKK